MYRPLLYSQGYWLMEDTDDNLHWMILSPGGEELYARSYPREGTKMRMTKIVVQYPGEDEMVPTGLYNIREVFRRVITPEVDDG